MADFDIDDGVGRYASRVRVNRKNGYSYSRRNKHDY